MNVVKHARASIHPAVLSSIAVLGMTCTAIAPRNFPCIGPVSITSSSCKGPGTSMKILKTLPRPFRSLQLVVKHFAAGPGMQQAQEPRTSGRTPHVPTAGSILQHLAAKKLSKWSTCDSWPWQNRQHRFSGTTCATQCVVVFLATKAGTGSTPAQAKVISFVWFVKNIQKLVFRLGILFAARCCSHDSYTHAADASSNHASL